MRSETVHAFLTAYADSLKAPGPVDRAVHDALEDVAQRVYDEISERKPATVVNGSSPVDMHAEPNDPRSYTSSYQAGPLSVYVSVDVAGEPHPNEGELTECVASAVARLRYAHGRLGDVPF